METVTNEDFTPQACADRLQRALDAEPLTLSVRGGGVPEEQSLVPRGVIVVARDEAAEIIRHLRTTPPASAP